MLNQTTTSQRYHGGLNSQITLFQWAYHKGAEYINYFLARECTPKEKNALWEKLHQVNAIIREIECLKDKKINSADLFYMNIVVLRKSSYDLFEQIRTIRKCKIVSPWTLDQIDQSLKTITKKLYELQSKDQIIEAALENVRDGECLVIRREYAGMGLRFFREKIGPESINCNPRPEPTCSPCAISYNTLRENTRHIGDPLFLPDYAKPNYQLKC